MPVKQMFQAGGTDRADHTESPDQTDEVDRPHQAERTRRTREVRQTLPQPDTNLGGWGTLQTTLFRISPKRAPKPSRYNDPKP